MPRTGERTPTGAERPSLSKGAFGPLEEENAHGPRGGSGSGRDEKPRVSRRRATGQPGAASSGASASTYRTVGLPMVTGGGATGRTPRGHPNCSGGHVRSGRHRRRHGQPGQRERRQLGDGGRATDQTEPGGTRFRATGGGASSNGPGNRRPGRKRASPAAPCGTTGDVMIEWKANARRSISGGSSQPSGSPGRVRRRKPAAPPGALHCFRPEHRVRLADGRA
jgi:hypothetical protein